MKVVTIGFSRNIRNNHKPKEAHRGTLCDSSCRRPHVCLPTQAHEERPEQRTPPRTDHCHQPLLSSSTQQQRVRSSMRAPIYQLYFCLPFYRANTTGSLHHRREFAWFRKSLSSVASEHGLRRPVYHSITSRLRHCSQRCPRSCSEPSDKHTLVYTALFERRSPHNRRQFLQPWPGRVLPQHHAISLHQSGEPKDIPS